MRIKTATALISAVLILTTAAGCAIRQAEMSPSDTGSSVPAPTGSSSGLISESRQNIAYAPSSAVTEDMYETGYMETEETWAPYSDQASEAGYGKMVKYDEPDWNTEEYAYTAENIFRAVKTAPFSTFAADVDTASYANVRRMILQGDTVTPDAVRAEEMINYFHYNYAEPENDDPFGVTTELAPCPWNPATELLMVGLQAKKLSPGELPAAFLRQFRNPQPGHVVPGQLSVGSGIEPFPAQPAQTPRQHDFLYRCRKVLLDIRALGQVADRPGRQSFIKQDLSRKRPQKTQDCFHQGCFPGPVFTDDAEIVAPLHRKIQILYNCLALITQGQIAACNHSFLLQFRAVLSTSRLALMMPR